MFIQNIIRMLRGERSNKWLVKHGCTIKENFSRGGRCFIDPSHCFLITIGRNVTMSINVTILAHDASTAKLTGYTKIGKVDIGDNVFIGANTTILPNVTIGKNAIIGSASVVTKNVCENMVVAGNPAKVICSVEEYKKKNEYNMQTTKIFSEEYKMGSGTAG